MCARWVELASCGLLFTLLVVSCGESNSAPGSAADEEGVRDDVVAMATAVPAVGSSPSGPHDTHRRARDDARLVLERYCGSCHISAYESALPGALAVYDLLEEEWASRATDLQLRDIVFRLGEPLGPDAEPLAVPAAERAAVERYVDLEIARRAAASGLDPTEAALPAASASP